MMSNFYCMRTPSSISPCPVPVKIVRLKDVEQINSHWLVERWLQAVQDVAAKEGTGLLRWDDTGWDYSSLTVSRMWRIWCAFSSVMGSRSLSSSLVLAVSPSIASLS